MVKLIEKTPCAGLLPRSIGLMTLAEDAYPAMTSIAPYQGQSRQVSAALKSTFGVGFPSPNRSLLSDRVRITWIGQGAAMICGEAPPTLTGAAVTDQSDAWAVVRLTGKGAEDVLARLVPVDLRRPQFRSNHTARTLLGHMHVSITRIDAKTFEIMAMRSMAQTLVHELSQAMENVAARG